MSTRPPRSTVDDVRAALPALDDVRPLVDQLLASSEPDEAHEWAGSGMLETAGSRLVDTEALRSALEVISEREAAHLAFVHRRTAAAVEALASGDPAAAAHALVELGEAEEGRGSPGRAEAFADAAVRVTLEAEDRLTHGLALRRRGRARRALARYREGAADYARAWEIADALDDGPGAAEAAVGMGNLLEDEGRWDEAAVWYRRALEVLDPDANPRPEVWHALLNLHVVLRSQGRLDEAEAYLTRAEAVAEELGDRSAAPFLENARGQWLVARGSFDEAVDVLRAAAEIDAAPRARVTIRLNLAEALLAAGRTLDAVEEARRAERDALVGRVRDRIPEAYRLLGRAAASEGNPDAFVLFERALERIEADGLPAIERARTLQAYAEAEARVGDAETAADLRRRALETYEELGIRGLRGPWSDQHAPGGSSDPDGEPPTSTRM